MVDEADLDLLEVKIRDIKEGARIIRTTRSQVAIPLIFGVGLFESDQYFAAESEEHQYYERPSQLRQSRPRPFPSLRK